ncbi:Ig-like protein group 2 [Dyadobacter jejuensis]|uniref:Ig-like protein group 2 n=1 Tax=Dyadobacter jejuensis TaxID=1082580 RepID=A0A316AKA4_9BACT|nr:Ig-like domain-containing protein [Dyadobacter jejuensis]PWJ58021.1 Ig-like protein group 2 [Dyadobacter jejuensis]
MTPSVTYGYPPKARGQHADSWSLYRYILPLLPIAAMLVLPGLSHAQQIGMKEYSQILEKQRVESEDALVWGPQVGPGNAGFANLVRYHPSIPGLVTVCPDMWNIYQSANNGQQWHSIKDYDGNGDFYHLRELCYSPTEVHFGLALESSRLWKTDDLGRSWTQIPNCPWYKADAEGIEMEGWRKKVAALALDPNNKNIWFVGGGANVRQQEWLSSYHDATLKSPHGSTADFEGKLWRTQDAGKSWVLVNRGLDPKAQVGRIIVNPMNSKQVFAASNYGIYRSMDGGSTWKQISKGKLESDIVMDMDFYYDSERKRFSIYVIDQVQYSPKGSTTTCQGGIFKSSDEGDTWVKINGDLGLDLHRLSGGVADSYYKFIAKWFGISQPQAKSSYPDLPKSALQYFSMLSVDPSREHALYIGFADPQIGNSITPGRVWTTTDDGKKWINTARLYEHIWTADKEYWEERGNPYHANMKVGHESPHHQSGNNYALRSTRGLGVGVDGSVMIISDHSTMLSTDHGASWQQVDEDYTASGAILGRGDSNLPALAIAMDKRKNTTLLGSGEHRVWIPTDDSPDQRLAVKFSPSAQETVSSMAFDPYGVDTVYAISNRQALKQYIFRSTDRGESWSKHGVATPATNAWKDDFYTNALTIDPIDPSYFYFGITQIVDPKKADQGGFYFSDDHGKTFSARNQGLPTPARIRDIVFDPRDPSRKSLFVAAEYNDFSAQYPQAQGGLYHSKDRGLHWERVKTPPTVKGVNHLALDHTNRLYITTGYRGGGDGLWYTDDFGTTWNQIFKYPSTECIDVSSSDHHMLVVTVGYLSKNPGVYFSKDRGVSWHKSNQNLANPNKIEDIKFDIHHPGQVWLATLGTGFYKGELKNSVSSQRIEVTPQVVEYRTGDRLTAKWSKESDKKNRLVWKSDNPSVVTVDQAGKLTAKSRGQAKVWVTSSDGRYADYSIIIISERPAP